MERNKCFAFGIFKNISNNSNPRREKNAEGKKDSDAAYHVTACCDGAAATNKVAASMAAFLFFISVSARI